MRSERIRVLCIAMVMSIFAIAMPFDVAGQQQQQEPTERNTRYKLTDLGTLGGPLSYLALSNGVNDAVNRVLNNDGKVVGWGDTSTLDPFAPIRDRRFQTAAMD